MDRLKGKRALITGGTSGIGLATAQRFAEEGARVIVTGSNPKSLDAARATLGESVLVLASDAGNVAVQKDLATAVQQHFGQLDVLFVNAGVAHLQPLDQWTEEAFDRSFAINVKGPYFLLQALLPIFAPAASIVLNGSVNAHVGMAGTSVYGATKAAVISWMHTLSGELIGRGIRVNAVSAGPIDTPLYSKLGIGQEGIQQVRSLVPLGRFGTPAEFANAVVFFASDESGFCVASELMIDGGMSGI